jgi:SAM-dependent methyltransferase
MHRDEFDKGFEEFQRLNSGRLPFGEIVPVLDESEIDVTYNQIYLLHCGWAARILAKTRPRIHVDIGSCSYFVAIASAFLNIAAFDLRPMNIPLPKLISGVADLTALAMPDNSLDSLSCMHAMEHVGLGRYYDKIDPDGDLKAARELQRVLAPNGNLLIVLPVGMPRVVFNAHRIYSYGHVMGMFSDLRLKQFTFIPMDRPQRIVYDADPKIAENVDEGAGCFWFTKDARTDSRNSTT